MCTPEAWTLEWRKAIDEARLAGTIAVRCEIPVAPFVQRACRAGIRSACELEVAGQPSPGGVTSGPVSPSTAPDPHAVAAALADAGYPRDDAGRILVGGGAGVTLAFDPNLRSPAMGLRNCLNGIMACTVESKSIDGCVARAPRCVTPTPWLGDPAGTSCCMTGCITAYQDARRSGKDESYAIDALFQHGGCFPAQ